MFRIAADVRTVPDRGRARIGAQGRTAPGAAGLRAWIETRFAGPPEIS